MKLLTCPQCKAANMGGAATCVRCQAPLPADQPSPKAESNPAPEAESSPAPEAAATPRRTARPLAWLCSDSMPPTGLFPSTAFNLGRDRTCDLSLPDSAVSRVHGRIIVGENSIAYEDLDSSNGSLLNGVSVNTSALQIGDTLVVGPYAFVVRGPDELTEADVHTQTVTRRFVTAVRERKGAALSGLIEEVPLTEILHSMELNRRTGVLSVESSEFAGEVVVRGGAPLRASLTPILGRQGRVTGREAILAILELEEGYFSLTRQDPGEIEGQAMPFSLTSLFLEGFRRKDQLEEDMDALFSDGQLIGGASDDGPISGRKTIVLEGRDAWRLLQEDDPRAGE